ncbi:hypothetical protein [Denitromonas iodatirespirans]|uniref:Uncharacterized protein n=1 Tax=Denitromonas iodatirespirans TaxID=2795389 RepID=A0A944DS09_DENI1|nr:hypothetical protein [Denitromonas iodatirespirans]MBT0963454.1 hypothetical protein [Denitromonas iodatirespirans]
MSDPLAERLTNLVGVPITHVGDASGHPPNGARAPGLSEGPEDLAAVAAF